MSRFNLIDEQWIPVRFPDGTRDELGIRDTLLRAKEIEAIEDPSPLVVASLHRFLLAVLYRALEGPTDIDQAKALFKAGLPSDKITDYLEKWRDRFWLFDDRYPFFQVPRYEPTETNGKKQWRSWSAMAAEHNADNAKVLFDHIDTENAGIIPCKKAVQWLIACQTFAVGGGKSDFQYTKSAPSATAVMVIPLGENLRDTLVLSLVPENREVLRSDQPLWEREPDSIESLRKGPARPAYGWADRYTWRSRSIRLRSDDEGNGVAELALASGIGCEAENQFDPMLGYRIDEKNGKLPVRFQERGLWRDFDSLLPDKSDKSHSAPLVIDHAVALARSCPDRFPRSVIVLGQANTQAKIEFWRMERFVLPTAIAGDKNIRSEIRGFLKLAETCGDTLVGALREIAKALITKGDRELMHDKWAAGRWRPGDVSKFIGKRTNEGVPLQAAKYWSTLEAKFHEILHAYALEQNPDEIEHRWLQEVRAALIRAWDEHCTALSIGDAWAIRALVKSDRRVSGKIKELDATIADFKKKPREDT